ncbi:unnamed protein product [Brassica rapa subsp. narinosa]
MIYPHHDEISKITRACRPRLRSRSLTELTRQITPPTKNGHAPQPIESRKSSQSVNPYNVWTWYATQAPDQFNKNKTMLVKKLRRIVGL